MKIGSRLIQYPLLHPKLITAILVVFTLVLGALIVKVQVDTDPENMLSEDEAVRVFHNQMKKEFTLHDVVVLGVVNVTHPDGVFNTDTLGHVHTLTEFAKTLVSEKHPDRKVVSRDIIAPGNVDTILQDGLGQVRFEWLMKEPPKTRDEAIMVREHAMNNPLLKGTLVAEDGKAIGIYIPVTSKHFAHEVSQKLQEKIEQFNGDDQFFITGLPVAEDTFGKEMFVQMAVSAPMAMLAIFILMLIFFRKLKLIISPMIVAMMTVMSTMGLLIGTGNTLHIMSSMIPIFLMPIAVVDSIHILSEFFDEYQRIGDRRKTIEHVMDQLFMPMFYTSMTSSAGFASLAFTPIPPVQVFGLFVAFGIMLAWFITIVFIPAYIMMMKEESLDNFGVQVSGSGSKPSLLSRVLNATGSFTYTQAKFILYCTLGVLIIAGYGISKIEINDNPMNWFTKSHPIRVADRALNSHFDGTYEAYLVFEAKKDNDLKPVLIASMLNEKLETFSEYAGGSTVITEARQVIDSILPAAADTDDFLLQLEEAWQIKMDASDDDAYEIWGEAMDTLALLTNRNQVFKRPDILRYIASLQEHVLTSGMVGKSNSITDVVKKVHMELFEGKSDQFRVPDTTNAVAQCLISFQNSHKPDDLWHFVSPNYTKANVWLQLKNGDNQMMQAVVSDVEKYLAANPPPVGLDHNWAGLTYLNTVWQDKMVSGMLKAFLSSFVVVFIMMAILFRSVLWGLLAMIPLSVTIALIYGIIGFVGKDYDMPVAVLSSLTLGLAVDFAIHFLERTRMAYKKAGSWSGAIKEMFEEPARAISRNVIVIAIGFTPLLAAPLVPYKTVGIFLASIMTISGIATMLILPASVTVLQKWLFRKS
jgi:uncharacterized protein